MHARTVLWERKSFLIREVSLERGSTAYTVLVDSEPAMRIGPEFQVAIPDLSEFHSTTDPDSMSQGSGSILVWTPNPNLKAEYCKRSGESEEGNPSLRTPLK